MLIRDTTKLPNWITCFLIVDKVDVAVQTNLEEDLQMTETHDITVSCEEEKGDDIGKPLVLDVENNLNSFQKKNRGGIPRAMDNNAAFRLATPFIRSPMFDRRTTL